MKVAFLWLCIASFASSFAIAQAIGQPDCPYPATSDWLSNFDGSNFPDKPLADGRVLVVTNDINEAIEMLAGRSVLPLGDAQVRKFTGKSFDALRQRTLRPYLVRAVFPTSSPDLEVAWDGRLLAVFAGGLGCSPYWKRPIIVLLEREPVQVHVSASAAL